MIEGKMWRRIVVLFMTYMIIANYCKFKDAIGQECHAACSAVQP